MDWLIATIPPQIQEAVLPCALHSLHSSETLQRDLDDPGRVAPAMFVLGQSLRTLTAELSSEWASRAKRRSARSQMRKGVIEHSTTEVTTSIVG